MTKREILDDISSLYFDIDACISALIAARLNKDDIAEADAIFNMETMMVATQQELSCIADFIKSVQC